MIPEKRTRICALLMLPATACLALGQEYTMSRWTIDGDGGRSEGGGFVLSGTIGQPDAAAQTGDGYLLAGGFWFQVPTGDCNVTGTVDLLDFSGIGDCISGPGMQTTTSCRCIDFDADKDIDLFDYRVFQTDIQPL
ncbi:MAG: hypothetical protein ACYTHJ_07585 [Planctomycetota bacterium]|jgi:hypothetical protein